MPDNTFITDKAETLGINLSEESLIKSLWEQYCLKIKSSSSLLGETDELEDALLEESDEGQEFMSDVNMIREILNTIREHEDSMPKTTLEQKIRWVEQRIMILNRLKGDLELSLRHASMNGEEWLNQHR